MDPLSGCAIRSHFAALPDPRVERTKRHALLDILTIALGAVICGADSWVEVERFGRAKRNWLRSFLVLPHGSPSHDTFGARYVRPSLRRPRPNRLRSGVPGLGPSPRDRHRGRGRRDRWQDVAPLP